MVPSDKRTPLRWAVAAPAVEVQVRDKVQPWPSMAPELRKSLNSISVGKRHPVLPLIVVVVQKLLAFANVSANVTGIHVWPPLLTIVAAVVGAVQTLFWRVAGAMHALSATVSKAEVLDAL